MSDPAITPINLKDQEPDPGTGEGIPAIDLDRSKQSRTILFQGKGALTEKELSTPGVRKLLVDDLDRAHQEIADLKLYKDKYHQLDKELAIQQERATRSSKKSIAFEIFTTGALTVASLLFGAARQLFDSQWASYGMMGAALLYIAAIVARIILR